MYSTDICLARAPRLSLLLVCATPSIHYTHLLCVLYTEGALLAPLLLQLQLLYSTCQWSLLTFPLPGGKVLYCRLLLSSFLCSFLPRVVVSCLLHTIQMHIMLMDTHAQPQTHTCWQALAHMCVVMHELSYHARTQRCSLSLSLYPPLKMTQKAIMLSVSFLKQFQHIAADAHTPTHTLTQPYVVLAETRQTRVEWPEP